MDPDGEDGYEIELIYRWSLNDEVLEDQETEALSLAEVGAKRGDNIKLEIIPVDEEDTGLPYSLTAEVVNSPPRILSQPSFSQGSPGELTYEVRAEDADGDKLTFSLVDPVAGISLDPSSGVLTYVPPKKGPTKESIVRIKVDDGNGGSTGQYFNIFPRQ